MIEDLGNGSGYVYEVLYDSTIRTHGNDERSAIVVQMSAYGSRMIQEKYFQNNSNYTEQMYDNTFGSRYYINSAAGALRNTIVGATEITDFLMPESKNARVAATIASGVITFTRKAKVTIVELTPEGGSFDQLDKITFTAKNFVQDDLVILTLATTSNTIELRDNSTTAQNLYLKDSASVQMTGQGTAIGFRYDGKTGEFYEMWRSNGTDAEMEVIEHTDYSSGTITINPTKKRVVLKMKAGTLTGNTTVTINEIDATTGFSKVGTMVWVQMEEQIVMGTNTLSVMGNNIDPSEVDVSAPSVLIWGYFNDNNGGGSKYESVVVRDGGGGWLELRKAIIEADVKTSNGSPVKLINAPGGGKFTDVLKAYERVDFNTTAYTTNKTGQLIFKGATNALYEADDVLGKTVSTPFQMLPVYDSLAGTTQVLENANLQYKAKTGNPSGGDSGVVVYVTYRIATY